MTTVARIKSPGSSNEAPNPRQHRSPPRVLRTSIRADTSDQIRPAERLRQFACKWQRGHRLRSFDPSPSTHTLKTRLISVMEWRDQVAVVTGGARGLGRATAWLLAQRGAAVCVNYVAHADAAETLIAEIAAAGGRAIAGGAGVAGAAAVRA